MDIVFCEKTDQEKLEEKMLDIQESYQPLITHVEEEKEESQTEMTPSPQKEEQ